MTKKVPFADGNWAVVKTVDDFSGDAQDDWFEQIDKLTEEAGGELANRHGRQMRDMALAMAVESWSYDLPMPFVPAHRRSLPLATCNTLYAEVRPLTDALNGINAPDPKTGTTGSGTSPGTSPENAPAPLPEPGGGTSGGQSLSSRDACTPARSRISRSAS